MSENNNWQPDPDYTAFLREQQEKVNGNDAFLKTYGFEHNCHCAEDYEEGNVVSVSMCGADMCDKALATCKGLKSALDEQKMISAELRVQVTTLGETPRA